MNAASTPVASRHYFTGVFCSLVDFVIRLVWKSVTTRLCCM